MSEQSRPNRKRGRKLLLLVFLPLMLALGGAAAAVMLGVDFKSLVTGAGAAVAEDDAPGLDPASVVFVDLPELLVNLNVTGARLRFLKFAATLEVGSEEEAALVKQFVPRITDNVHAYLRAVQVEELGGPDALYRVKRDLLARVNQEVRPVRVRDVLIKEMLVQ